MPIPGLAFGGFSGLLAVISTSANTPLDLASLLEVDASAPVFYRLVIASGVVRGSNGVGSPAIDATGLHADSSGFWIVDGGISGIGGDGGYAVVGGSVIETETPGGGGGGAGAAVGIGGLGAAPDGLDGADGTATTGGAAGSNGVSGNFISAFIAGTNGGDAVALNHAVTAVVTGSIRGGGGGGSYGYTGTPPGAGGNLDQDGAGFAPGVKGYAVRLSGSGSWSYTGGGTVGTVG